MLITLFLFLIASFFSFYIPGLALIHILGLKLEKGTAFVIIWTAGVCFFILTSYLLAWVNASYAIFAVLLFFSIYALRKKIILSSISFASIDRLTIFIILLGSLSFLSITFFSGITTQNGLQFIKVNSADGILHISWIINQTIFFPPQHPGLSGVEFKGYHYFYDFLLSRFVLLYHFSPLDLYFRFFPALISLLYGGGFFLIGSLITIDKVKRRLILFLAYFSQSFAFILLALNNNYDIVQGGQLVQPISLILNPSIVLSISVLLGGIFLFPKIKESWKYGLLAGLLLGVLSQIKIYSGITAVGTLLIYGFFLSIKYRKKYIINYLPAVIITAFITAITYFPNNLGVGTLVFAPLLIYRNYMEQMIFAHLNWETRRIIFDEHHNIIRIIQLYLEAFTIFWVVNLGIRILPLFFIKKIFSREFWIEDSNIILLSMILIPIIIPSFFIQSISVFDILQFDWIVLALLSIPAGLVLGNLIRINNTLLKGTIFLILVIIFFQNSYFVFSYLFPTDKYLISQVDVNFYNKITTLVPQKSFIATLQDNQIPLISALTGRSTYYEKELTPYPLDYIYSERKTNLIKLKQSIDDCNYKEIDNQMHIINTKYLITSYISPCLNKSMSLKRYIVADKLAFYEFK